MMGNSFGMGWGFGWGFMVLFWILVILFFGWIIRVAVGDDEDEDSQAPQKSALELLKERYARGEISREEFRQKKRDLEG